MTANDGRIRRFSKEKIQIIRSLDLLVIDEISMVRADLLDMVDAVLRYHRRNQQPFGGVQLLMLGDLHQLPPVAQSDSWQILEQHYQSVYFFSSQALAQTELVTIELQHIFRQSDPLFINLLNKVRDTRLDGASAAALNQRHRSNLASATHKGVITLTTHNAKADAINQKHLQALGAPVCSYRAEVAGDFPENAYPAPATLEFKVGAQVMFLRNDASGDQRYFNGKIGTITHISQQTIQVRCEGDNHTIDVEPVTWDNIKYTINEEKKELEQEVVGKFQQFPLKLAWAITIHKSQGLTFDKVVIDAAGAFASGQVYVALSRCRTLEGIVLTAPIPTNGIKTDPAILAFNEQVRQNPVSGERLEQAMADYEQRLLRECFDLQPLNGRLNYLMRLLQNNASVVQASGGKRLIDATATFSTQVLRVSERFKAQLQSLFEPGRRPSTHPHTMDRLRKASIWFGEQFSAVFGDWITRLSVETDNKELRRQISRAIENLQQDLAVKLAGIESCREQFSPDRYLHSLGSAQMGLSIKKAKPPAPPEYQESEIEHVELFEQLKQWRAKVSEQEQVHRFQVMHQRVLIQLAIHLPRTSAELKTIRGVGKRTVQKYGDDLLALIMAYCDHHKIRAVSPPAKPLPHTTGAETTKKKKNKEKQQKQTDTKQASLALFNQGMAIDAIARERNLSKPTIEGHLCHFVTAGELDIDRLVPQDKQQAIEAVLKTVSGKFLTEIKEKLPKQSPMRTLNSPKPAGIDLVASNQP